MTGLVLVGTVSPAAFWIATLGWAVKTAPLVASDGWAWNATFVGFEIVTLPLGALAAVQPL